MRAESAVEPTRSEKHHSDLAALGGLLGLRLGLDGGFRCRRGSTRKLADGGEQYPPMPKQDTNILEVLISQVGQCCDADTVLGKTIRTRSQSAICCMAQSRRDRAYGVSDQDI